MALASRLVPRMSGSCRVFGQSRRLRTSAPGWFRKASPPPAGPSGKRAYDFFMTAEQAKEYRIVDEVISSLPTTRPDPDGAVTAGGAGVEQSAFPDPVWMKNVIANTVRGSSCPGW